MKPIFLTLICTFITLSLYSQGNYVFENVTFDYMKKIEIAKKHRIKSISYYPNYKDSLKKGKCEKKEIYDTTGILLKAVYSPNTKKEYKKYSFVYDKNNRLIELNYFFSKRDKVPFRIILLDYYQTGQLKSMTEKYPHGKSNPDTLFYYYTEGGRYEYKVWGKNPDHKMYIRYNKCNKIEYVETRPYKNGSIQLDSNGCMTYVEIEKGEDFDRYTYNDNCQVTSNYGVYNFGKEWNIWHKTYEYNTNNFLIRIISKESQAKTKAKCEENLKVKSIIEIEYNNKGLRIFTKTKNETGKIIANAYIEYEYY